MAGKKKQPYGINNVVSWGATVVIIGLLFKIQHLPNGGLFISIGLGMEAVSFFIEFIPYFNVIVNFTIVCNCVPGVIPGRGR